MAFVYEIIDTYGEPDSKLWKRLVNATTKNLELDKIKDTFLNSRIYTFSDSKNIIVSIIEKIFSKIFDESDLYQTTQNRKNFWIQARIDRFGPDCLIKRIAESKEEDLGLPAIIKIKENIIKEETEKPLPIEPEILNIDTDNTSAELIENENANKEIGTVSIDNKSNDQIFNSNVEIRFNDSIYSSIEEYLKATESDLMADALIKFINGNVPKGFKKKYKDILVKTFIKKDNDWVALL